MKSEEPPYSDFRYSAAVLTMKIQLSNKQKIINTIFALLFDAEYHLSLTPLDLYKVSRKQRNFAPNAHAFKIGNTHSVRMFRAQAAFDWWVSTVCACLLFHYAIAKVIDL